jgi:hypothetical protein
MEINTGLPCAGRFEAWDPASRRFVALGRFETVANQAATTVTFRRVETDRVRAVVERIDPANRYATIYSWRWDDPRGK